MRTTLEVSDAIYRKLKRKAADEGATVRQVVENALRLYLGKPKARKGYQLHWRPERGRILPGVRLDDRNASLILWTAGRDRARHQHSEII